MKKLIQQFPQQLSEAIAIGRANKINFENTTFNQVLLSGLGGSGIGGTIVQDYMNDKLSIPFAVNKNYAIPKAYKKIRFSLLVLILVIPKKPYKLFKKPKKKSHYCLHYIWWVTCRFC